MILEKSGQAYAHVLHWIRSRIGFSLLRASIMYVQGARSFLHCPVREDQAAIDLALTEIRVLLQNEA